MTDVSDLLRCPRCDAAIAVAREETRCTSGHRFPIIDGVPVFDAQLRPHSQYEEQRRYFDAEFSTYRQYRLENWRIGYLRRLREAGLLGNGPVVDVGVGGSGYTVIEAARDGSVAVGCDLSLPGLATARRFAQAEDVDERTTWLCCSAERLPLASAAFSSALAIAVLEHVPDDEAALAELARVLRPGGRAWVTVPHAMRHIPLLFRGSNRRHDRRLGHLRRYEAEQLVDAGRRVGLEVEEIQFTGHPVKVLQLVASPVLGDRFWWWCERRDRRRRGTRRGSMQLSVVFKRTGS